jgi:serine/threonine protein kinase
MPAYSLVAGQKLSNGKYEVTEYIGRGGMSEVFKGIDVKLKRTVAIKVLDPEFASNPYWIRRFREEAETAANLEHPSIVTIYDIHEQENLHYCVMQYLPQGLVSMLKLKKRALSTVEAVQVLEPIAEALAFVHKKGVVHRDIKPGNIMLDEHDAPVLTDFGIAVRDNTTRLEGHATTGTPEYMSPEQVRGEVDIDGRSDVYSLGIVLYELLTGNVPYHSEDPQAVFYQQVHEPIPEKPLKDHHVPKRVKEVLFRCLEKAARDRYQSADALVEAFNDILRNPPTLRSFRPRRHFPFAAVLVPAILVVAAAVLYAMLKSGAGFDRPHPAPVAYLDTVLKSRFPSRPRSIPVKSASPLASFGIYLRDSTQPGDTMAVPFPGEISLAVAGEEERAYPVPHARAIIRFWPAGGKAIEETATDGPVAVIDLRHSLAETDIPFRISTSIPWYKPMSEMLTLRKGASSQETLSLAPVALRCGGCSRTFAFEDTICSSCDRKRTKWPLGKTEPE